MVSRGTVRNEIASWFGSSFKDIIITGSGNLPANKAIMVKEGLGYALIIGSSITFGMKNTLPGARCSRKCAQAALYPEAPSAAHTGRRKVYSPFKGQPAAKLKKGIKNLLPENEEDFLFYIICAAQV